MNKPSSPTAHAVVWIDHHHAYVAPIEASAAEPRHLKAHSHPTAQHGSAVRSEHEFYASVCKGLEGMGAILVTGSRTGLADFRHYVEKHRPLTMAQVVAYEVAAHPTENQLVALGKQFFEISA